MRPAYLRQQNWQPTKFTLRGIQRINGLRAREPLIQHKTPVRRGRNQGKPLPFKP